MMLIGTFCGL